MISAKAFVQPTNTNTKSLIHTLAGSKAAVGTSDVMEVNTSHLTLFTDLCAGFVGPLRIYRPQAQMALQNGRTSVPPASTFTGDNRRRRSKANKSNEYTCLYDCASVCVCEAGRLLF